LVSTEEQAFMEIIDRVGDVIDGPESVIIHGCNAAGAFGSGMAKAVRERLPFAYAAYRQRYLRGLVLGDIVWAINLAEKQRPRIVGNAISQKVYGPGDKQYVNYEAIRSIMRAVDRFCLLSQDSADIDIAGITPIRAVGMPAIGSGLGGGDWATIADIIQHESQHFQPVVYRLQ
jgi:O-acetyl-ADP-ribose deacetylase (regulator of RNase III)